MSHPRLTLLRALATGTLVLVVGCRGYSWVKKSDLVKPPTVIVDSAEIMVLRKRIDSLEVKAKADSVKYTNAAKAGLVPDTLVRARDAEIASLKDQLSKATAELERIKKRLATPRQSI